MGMTEPHAKGALMINLLGYASADSAEGHAGYQRQREALQAMDGATLHWYGKVPRYGRKLGHVTFLLDAEGHEQRAEECARRLDEVRAVWPWPEGQESP
jgi:5-(carboxyamino)imidazole ribonucleotide synthase